MCCFKVAYVSGEIQIQPEEIQEAKFVALNEENIDEYITRPHMKSRTLDAMRSSHFIPYETWEVQPYNLIGDCKEKSSRFEIQSNPYSFCILFKKKVKIIIVLVLIFRTFVLYNV